MAKEITKVPLATIHGSIGLNRRSSVPWTLVAAVVAVLVLVGCGGSDSEAEAEAERLSDRSDAEVPQDRASAICAEYGSANPDVSAGALLTVSATTVGDMQALLTTMGQAPISEWASRSDAEFIASCSYSRLGDHENAPTTICEDGSVFSLAEPVEVKVLVDEEGQSVPDPTQNSAPRSPPCG